MQEKSVSYDGDDDESTRKTQQISTADRLTVSNHCHHIHWFGTCFVTKALKTSQDRASLPGDTWPPEAVTLTAGGRPAGRDLSDSKDSRKAGTFWPHSRSETHPEILMVFVTLPAE